MAYTNTPIHDKRFPGETEKYRKSRDELLRAEMALRAQAEAVALQRRQLPTGGAVPTDYVFQGWDDRAHAVRDVRLSELFGEKDTLFLYSFMFIPGEKGLPLEVGCPSCTSIIDAMDGQAQHIEQQMSFAVEAKAPIELFQAHARTRGWQHARLLSSAGTTYRTDYNSEQEDGEQLPIATIFVRRGSQIRHFWSSELFYAPPDPGQDMRHVDFMWPVWAALDHSPEGRPKGWGPELTY